MSENTKIEWTDHTWSPWYGCTKVSPGCANCYAETLNHRWGQDNWGKGKPRRPAADWNKPRRWNKQAAANMACLVCGSDANSHGFCEQCEVECYPRPILVFPSQCDWLDPEVPVELLAEFLQLIHDTPNLTWQLLTKRPELFRERMQQLVGGPTSGHVLGVSWLWGETPSNVWVGASVEDQPRANERIPELLKIPAVLRFLSVEPLIGPVDLRLMKRCSGRPICACADTPRGGIDWVIIGGESGPGARPCNVNWIRDIRDQCKAASVPVFVKQLGKVPVDTNDAGYDGEEPNEWPMGTDFRDLEPRQYQGAPVHVLLNHPKGGDPDEWPEDLRVREMPKEVAA